MPSLTVILRLASLAFHFISHFILRLAFYFAKPTPNVIYSLVL
jgi:hypothetical protein